MRGSIEIVWIEQAAAQGVGHASNRAHQLGTAKDVCQGPVRAGHAEPRQRAHVGFGHPDAVVADAADGPTTIGDRVQFGGDVEPPERGSCRMAHHPVVAQAHRTRPQPRTVWLVPVSQHRTSHRDPQASPDQSSCSAVAETFGPRLAPRERAILGNRAGGHEQVW